MHKLIPSIYFYVVSLIGLVLLLIGLFGLVHYVIGVTAYPNYPLNPFEESRCLNMVPQPLPGSGQNQEVSQQSKNECEKTIENERTHQKTDDLEKALSFSIIGGILFAIHFSWTRKKQ